MDKAGGGIGNDGTSGHRSPPIIPGTNKQPILIPISASSIIRSTNDERNPNAAAVLSPPKPLPPSLVTTPPSVLSPTNPSSAATPTQPPSSTTIPLSDATTIKYVPPPILPPPPSTTSSSTPLITPLTVQQQQQQQQQNSLPHSSTTAIPHQSPALSPQTTKTATKEPFRTQPSAAAGQEKAPKMTVSYGGGVGGGGGGLPKLKRTFKVIIIGDANVGKTCLSFRFCNGRFPERTEATIGVDFRERAVTIDGELLRVQLWDTAGQERFRQSMVAHYYRNVQAVVFVYDMTKPQSFANLAHWIAECKAQSSRDRVSEDEEGIPMILVGNKCDMNSEIAVQTNDAQKFADSHDMPLFETSAKADSQSDHVESIFMTLVHKLKESKGLHVQSEAERASHREENKILRASQMKSAKETQEEGWCC